LFCLEQIFLAVHFEIEFEKSINTRDGITEFRLKILSCFSQCFPQTVQNVLSFSVLKLLQMQIKKFIEKLPRGFITLKAQRHEMLVEIRLRVLQ
jgi:hypothetical protein